MIFDPRYLLFVMLPTMALAFFAQWWVKSAFNQASQIPNSRRLTGAQAARQILDSAGLVSVPIQPTQTAAMRQGSGSSPSLDDHYETVSRAVVDGRLVLFLGTDANLCGRPPALRWTPGRTDCSSSAPARFSAP